jgi:hypothetical protein
LQASGGEVRLVVLDHCDRDAIASAFAEVVDCVIAIRTVLDDPTTAQFITALYRALGDGHDVRHAFDIATFTLAAMALDDHPAVLHVRTGANAELALLAQLSDDVPSSATPA